MGLSRTVSEINGYFENHKFSPPRVFNAPAEGVSLGFFFIGGSPRKTSIMPLPHDRTSLTTCIHFHTDGYGITMSRSACIGIVTRDKNVDETESFRQGWPNTCRFYELEI